MKHFKFLLLTVLLTLVGRTYADNLTVANVEMKPGESKNVAISLENPTKKYTAFQFDLELPEGVTVELKNNGKPKISLNEDRIDDHTLTVQDLGSGTYRLLCFSMSNAELYGTSGTLITMTLHAADNVSAGAKTGNIKSQVFTETSGTQVKWDDFSFTVTIAAAVVPEVTADNKSREYGEENPAFTYTTSASLTGEPSLTTTATKTSPVGEYDIVVERGTITGDYTAKNGKLTITKAPLTITAKSYTIKQGDALPTFEAEYSGFKNSETSSVLTTQPTITTSATSASESGTYDIVVSGASGTNYDISYVKGTLTITKADEVVVTAKSYSRRYGEANPTFEYTTSGATLSGTPSITCAATATSPVGEYDIVASKGTVTNYNVTYVNGKLAITKAPLTITAKSYTIKQGEALPTFEADYDGFKNNETSSVLTTQPTFSCSAISTSAPGTYDIVVSGADATNYDINYVKGTLTIDEGINGVFYEFNGDEAIVVAGPYKYQGNVVIPASVNYNGKEYSVTGIGSMAFTGCSGLTSITIPTSVTSIGDRAFYGCSGLTSITIPTSVTSIGSWVFTDCSGLTKVTINNNTIVSKNYSFSGSLEGIFGTQVKEYIIGDEVQSIGNNAFSGCKGLISVTIGKSVTEIGQWAFSGCSDLTIVTINSNAIVSQNYSLSSSFNAVFGSQVKEYIIGDEVQSIGDYAFYGCLKLISVTIPNSVTSIGIGAFLNCRDLTSITIPNSVTSIGEMTFKLCTSLTILTIPSCVITIGKEAFYNCSGLTTITIPNNVTNIGENAFSYCTSLASITIPTSVTSMGDNAFRDCTALQKVIVSDIATWCGIKFGNTYANPLYYAKHLYSDENTEITDLLIPNSVTSIGIGAFYGCIGLTSIEIPNSVTHIYYSAFYDCSGLTSVKAFAKTPPTGQSAFPSNQTITLYVPRGSKAAYETADIWKVFSSIVEFGESEEPFTVTANDLTMVYGDAVPELTYKAEGGSFTGTPQITCEATSTSPVGTYTIIISKGTIDSDNGTYVNGTLTVTKAPLTITAKSYTIMQGNAMPSFEVEYDGFKNGETSSVLSTQPVITTTATDTKTPGTYEIIVASASATNYDVSFVNGILIIEPINIDPVDETETTTFSEEVNENTDLSNTVIDNTYYTVNTENGDGYDATEQAIVLNSTTTTEQMDAVQNAEVGDATMQENYNGIIFEVAAGSGTITIDVKTKGTYVLNVQIGKGEPNKITKSERGTADVAYNVTAPTYIYLYASTASGNAAPRRAAGANSVLLYGYKVTPGGTGIREISADNPVDVYNMQGNKVRSKATTLSGLPKGIYIVNGRKVIVK